ncbi:uncharacterized protein ATNIH1004_001635 [Aspergillus tanneri]|uniref:Uncharacterized protein n=1 Tax=Aspergillus tanneri TaxID=1220188 RepID=A0A5M9N4U4_9EURO|nr:uncharacterized protein ATNIH1004_001635 [Aspergillus tanneri]KAA8652730.1 hypothetical protein ATNIH1004_001635 [Aspergillus tanneri]
MSKGGRQKVDRRAIAAANGYIRGANREQDQNRCEYHYPDESLTLQDKASEEDKKLRVKGLRIGQPVPDLAMVKDFIHFYIFSSHGIISLHPTKSSVLNFVERFFAGFTRLTKSVFDKKDTQGVYRWIAKSLVKEGIIEDKR